MIELIAAAVMGAGVGGGVVWRAMRDRGSWRYTANLWCGEYRKAMTTLTALRSNCFIPDERGVKVRYSEASVARRVKAETPKEVG